VVSGSHLLFLKKWVRWSWLQFPLLACYAGVTGYQPPVIRALVQIAVQIGVQRWRLHWSSANVVLASGLLTWALEPSWISSISFQLSWICALALSLTEDRSALTRVAAFYFSTSVVLARFQWPHPVSMVMNAFVAPVIGEALFPFSALCFLVPWLTPLVDLLWRLVLFVGEVVTEGNVMFPSLTINTLEIWMALWFFHFLVHLKKLSDSKM
jgi:ComEC/Rec2-related protein